MTTTWNNPDPSPEPRRRRVLVTLVAVGGVLAIIAAAVVAFTVLADDSTASAAVQLETADDIGDDPFTNSVAIGPAVEFPGNVQAVNASVRDDLTVDTATATRVAEGTTPGLYGGSGQRAVCDPAELVEFLVHQPKKAAAWAAVFGIDSGDIQSYVGGLIPVVLSSDTLVTNHGFRDGHANAFPAVLQAGTAVMVDAAGVPRVKCNCGNPLTESPSISLGSSPTNGPEWEDFTIDQVVTVRPGTSTGSLTLTDVVTGEPVEVTVGPVGAWVAAARSDDGATLFRSPNGKDWEEVGSIPGKQVNGLTWDGDRWLAIARDTDTTTVLTSTDLRDWTEAPSVPAVIEDIDWADGKLVAVGTDGTGDGESHGAIYTSTDGTNWSPASATLRPESEASMVTDVTHGPDGWVALGVSSVLTEEPTRMLLTSPDGTSAWQVTSWSETAVWGFDGDRSAIAASNDDLVVAGEPAESDGVGLQVGPDPGSLIDVPGSPFDDNPADGMAWGASDGLAYSWGTYEPGDPITSTFLASADGTTWATVGELDRQVLALAWGPNESASTDDSRTTTTTVEGVDLHAVDWMNRSYLLSDCPTGGLEAALLEGDWISPDGADGIRLADVQYGDLTGDGAEEALLTFECYPVGGNAYPLVVSLVFASEAGGPAQLGGAIGGASPAIVGDSVQTSDAVFLESDPRCCPSGTDVKTWRYRDGAWVPS